MHLLGKRRGSVPPDRQPLLVGAGQPISRQTSDSAPLASRSRNPSIVTTTYTRSHLSSSGTRKASIASTVSQTSNVSGAPKGGTSSSFNQWVGMPSDVSRRARVDMTAQKRHPKGKTAIPLLATPEQRRTFENQYKAHARRLLLAWTTAGTLKDRMSPAKTDVVVMRLGMLIRQLETVEGRTEALVADRKKKEGSITKAELDLLFRQLDALSAKTTELAGKVYDVEEYHRTQGGTKVEVTLLAPMVC